MGKGFRKKLGIDGQKRVPWEAAMMEQAARELTLRTLEVVHLCGKRKLL